jgi:hypothetical protein
VRGATGFGYSADHVFRGTRMNYSFLDHFKNEPLTDATRDYLFQDYDAEDDEEIKAFDFFREQGKKFDFTLLGVDIFDGVNEDAVIIEKFEKTLKSGAIDNEFSRAQQINRTRSYVTVVRLSGKIIGFDQSDVADD